MGYLKEFQTQISNRDFNKFMTLWEEYCTSENVPPQELMDLLSLIKTSDFVKPMGKYVETLIPLWKTLSNPEISYTILRLIIDIETSNTQELFDLATQKAQEKHGKHPKYHDLMKMAGFRSKENFQGALSQLDLLAHLSQGNFLYHPGGWGVGEIMEISLLREQLVVEFENLQGKKTLSFSQAMKLLAPVSKTHFLSRRFSQPDELEKEARSNPVETVKMLLRDLGPKSAQEIKDAMCELVIPEEDWAKWWQNTRSRLKKDLAIETPEALKEPFRLRDSEISHQEKLEKRLQKKRKPEEIIQACHSFSKEEPGSLKEEGVKNLLLSSLQNLLNRDDLPKKDRIQILFLLYITFPGDPKTAATKGSIDEILNLETDLIPLIDEIEILQYKKQILQWIREKSPKWIDLFIKGIKTQSNSLLREYILKELNGDVQGKERLAVEINALFQEPANEPDLFFWLFSRFDAGEKEDFPLADSEHTHKWWEGLLILLSRIENTPSFQELTKKILMIINEDRYKKVRDLFKNADYEFVKECLLLASKCHSITDRDQKSIKSLAAVHYPDLSIRTEDDSERHTLWTTEQGYMKTQLRIQQIGTVEMIDVAREIEAARALGDLRENSEYKFAKERRARLQGEMRRLSEEIKKARIITPLDVLPHEAAVGSIVTVEDERGGTQVYQILGPWDADPNGHILSYQSKLAQAMLGIKEGESFQFKEESYKITSLKTIFDK